MEMLDDKGKSELLICSLSKAFNIIHHGKFIEQLYNYVTKWVTPIDREMDRVQKLFIVYIMSKVDVNGASIYANDTGFMVKENVTVLDRLFIASRVGGYQYLVFCNYPSSKH